MRLIALVLPALFLACSSRELTADHASSTQEAIQGGTDDTTHTFAMGVCSGPGPAQCQGICSGALIAPNLVVTARHCVDHINYSSSASNPPPITCSTDTFGSLLSNTMFVTTNQNMQSSSGNWYAVKSIKTTTSNKVCGNDLALLVLNSNVPSNIATPATPLVQYPMTDHTKYLATFTAIGYGITAVGANDAGKRRIRQKIDIQCIEASPNLNESCNDPTGIGAPNEFVSFDGICSGDSGSSAFEQSNFNAGKFVSMGVLSRGGEDGTKCVGGIYTRLDPFADFIVTQAKAAATLGGYPEPPWTVPGVVTPTTDAGTSTKKDAGGSSGSTTHDDGIVCGDDTECTSGHCVPSGGSNICASECDPAGDNTCADGNSCQAASGSNFCIPTQTTAAPTGGEDSTGGCALASGTEGSHSALWGTAPLGMLALLSIRRRRR